MAGRVGAQHDVEVCHREELGVVGGRLAPDVKQPLLVVVAFSRGDRRSFLWRAVAAGSVVAGAALTAACPGPADSDQADAKTIDSDTQ